MGLGFGLGWRAVQPVALTLRYSQLGLGLGFGLRGTAVGVGEI